jgi:hypothetical protein
MQSPPGPVAVIRVVLIVLLLAVSSAGWSATSPGTVLEFRAEARIGGNVVGEAVGRLVVANPLFKDQVFYSPGRLVIDKVINGITFYRWEADPVCNGVRIKRLLGSKGPGNVDEGIQVRNGSLFRTF